MSDEIKNTEPSLDDIFSRKKIVGEKGNDKAVLPFKFLDSYTREDKNIFFGRDSETEDIFRKFYSGNSYWFMVNQEQENPPLLIADWSQGFQMKIYLQSIYGVAVRLMKILFLQ